MTMTLFSNLDVSTTRICEEKSLGYMVCLFMLLEHIVLMLHRFLAMIVDIWT